MVLVSTSPYLPLAALALLLACHDTLVDGSASPDLLNPSCRAGQAVCTGACVAEDAAHCGAGCADCTTEPVPDPNGFPACVAGACGFACGDGFLRGAVGCRRPVAVSAGFAHSCALLDGGEVRCWGANDHGQLGNGATADESAPVPVALPGPATAIVCGYIHTCAVVAGAVWCWGDNSTGALGDGTTTARSSPVQVAGLSGATALAAGGGENGGGTRTYYGHTCALAGGAASCWGGNESGQLGDGTFVSRRLPAPVTSLGSDVQAISAGDRHTCALESGAVRCWGADAAGELGDGGSANAPTPQLAISAGAVAVAAGASHTCAATGAAGGEALSCWGSNDSGQVAGGVNAPAEQRSAMLVDVGTLHPTVLAAGGAHTCAAAPGQANGTLCFGANGSSQLGAAATPRGRNAPALAGVGALAAGFAHTCALLSDGGLRCWGANDRGQLGLGPGAPAVVAEPAPVSGR